MVSFFVFQRLCAFYFFCCCCICLCVGEKMVRYTQNDKKNQCSILRDTARESAKKKSSLNQPLSSANISITNFPYLLINAPLTHWSIFSYNIFFFLIKIFSDHLLSSSSNQHVTLNVHQPVFIKSKARLITHWDVCTCSTLKQLMLIMFQVVNNYRLLKKSTTKFSLNLISLSKKKFQLNTTTKLLLFCERSNFAWKIFSLLCIEH